MVPKRNELVKRGMSVATHGHAEFKFVCDLNLFITAAAFCI